MTHQNDRNNLMYVYTDLQAGEEGGATDLVLFKWLFHTAKEEMRPICHLQLQGNKLSISERQGHVDIRLYNH